MTLYIMNVPSSYYGIKKRKPNCVLESVKCVWLHVCTWSYSGWPMRNLHAYMYNLYCDLNSLMTMDPILENMTYRTKFCVELFIVLGW